MKEVSVPADADEQFVDQQVPPPDAPPPTMPEEVRAGGPPPAPPGYAGKHRADGDRKAGGIPPGTGPEVPSLLGSSEETPVAEGVHDPDVGPGGGDLDTARWPLAGRPESAR